MGGGGMLLPACALLIVLAVPARAQDTRPGSMFEAALPGGLHAALSAVDDRAAGDRSQFLLELIRRSERVPIADKSSQGAGILLSLAEHLERAATHPGADAPSRAADTVPLPLSPDTWITAVFGGAATADTLIPAILRSRGAALLYCGLLSLDEETRAWLNTRPDLVRYLASDRAAAFLIAAPGLRVSGGRMRLPGGDAAVPAWEELAGERADRPASFIRAVVDRRDGRLAYFLGSLAQVTPPRVAFALNLDAADPDARVASARRLFAVFDRLAVAWNPERQPFTRPALDPALLLGDLGADAAGRPILRWSRRLWSAVFDESRRDDLGEILDGDAGAAGEPADFAWLCERVFEKLVIEYRRRYNIVLFASRMNVAPRPEGERVAAEAFRAAGRYPALVAALERAGLTDPSAYAAAARRAARLSAIDDRTAAFRALAQFQGALALLARAALRGSLAPDAFPALVSSLSRVEVSDRGEYEGRLMRWLDANLASPSEGDLLRMLAGRTAGQTFVEWEGTRYRVDLVEAEAIRLTGVLGSEQRPYVTSARALLIVADTVGDQSATAERLRTAAQALAEVADAVGLDRRLRDVLSTLRQAARGGDARPAPTLAPALRNVVDDLLARGLLELAYAVGLGVPEAVPISPDEAASRHDFGHGPAMSARRTRAWDLPEPDFDDERGWHLTGSILGLDVRLAKFSLVRRSSRIPPRRPTLDDVERRVFTEAVPLMDAALLSDSDRDAIVEAIRRGRERLAGIRSAADARTVADEIGLSPARRTLLAWTVAHDRERAPFFLSLSELLWLGLAPAAPPAALDAWGAPGEPRLGCLCLRMIDRRPWEMLTGRWNSGVFASGVPDLNLRLAELLAGLRMPAVLLGPVLAGATVDLIEHADVRDPDDRRGLLEFVEALTPERVEEYLALLTTDGPLVPVDDAPTPAQGPKGPR